MILGFVFLCMLPAAVPQNLTPRGPRPIPGRGDRPGPTPPPIQPGQQGCTSEFYFCFDFSCIIVIFLIFGMQKNPAVAK